MLQSMPMPTHLLKFPLNLSLGETLFAIPVLMIVVSVSLYTFNNSIILLRYRT